MNDPAASTGNPRGQFEELVDSPIVDRWSTRKRGRLRILLGAAPGAGKTYAMLREGIRLRDEGHDTVAGLVEAHGREETIAQIGDLDIIPRKAITHRGVQVDEMDIDALLARKPEIVLVDELAHTNAPGSRNEKRYQDVEELRAAGINVIATMNVQHVASLNDVMRGITGVDVHETVPDSVLDDAEVQLIDIPVDALIDRLEQGKVYPAGLARQALEHFFRPGNLAALRELALRRTAAGVDDELAALSGEQTAREAWRGTGRVMALVDASLASGDVLRSAWRLASALRLEMVAVAVTPAGGFEALAGQSQTTLERNLRLAEDLGATTRLLEGDQMAETLATAAREDHATLLVLGYAPGGRWSYVTRRPLVDQLLDLLDDVDIHLVKLDDGERVKSRVRGVVFATNRDR